MTVAHPCEHEGHHEDQMGREDEEKVDSGIVDDRFDNAWSFHGHRAGVQPGFEAEADDDGEGCRV